MPLHQQALAWAMKQATSTLVQLADNYMFTQVGRRSNSRTVKKRRRMDTDAVSLTQSFR